MPGESWLQRPLSAGWFMGVLHGSRLVDDWVGQREGFFAGYRLGRDFNHSWGAEMRFAFGSVGLFDSQAARRQAETIHGEQWNQRYDQRRDCQVFLWDVDLLYYPWGDAVWRPYLSVGLGTAEVRFEDRLARRWNKTLLAMPLAIGLKRRCSDCVAVRLEVADNIAFAGGGINTLNNISLTGAVEIRFGGSRRAYWPWNPGRHYW